MSKKTLFVSDLDGTLLNSDTKISDNTAEILNRLITCEDVLFTVATARTPATVVPLLKDLKLSLPQIVMTGAAMWMPGGSYAEARVIEPKKVDRIVEICNFCDINPFVYAQAGNTLDVMHSKELTDEEERFVVERRNSPFKHFFLRNEFSSTSALLIFATAPLEKLKKAEALILAEKECDAVCYHDIFAPEYGFLEIYACGTSKASAIKSLAKQIDAEKIVVFGDNLNDISMLRIADIGIAVGNAYPEVKNEANIVIGTNNHDSVARWIEDNHATI